MSFEPTTIVLDSPQDHVARITFNRPDVKNALNREMVHEIRGALDEILSEPSTRAVIFAGSSEVFVSGADIGELRNRGKMDALAFINNGLFRDIEEFPLPTIAAIRGWALGGGCELAASCDFRVAGRGARFGQPEVKLGILPGAGATYRLPRLIGLAHAKDLVLTGRIVDAEEAHGMGLVTRVVDDNDVVDASIELASSLASNAPLAIRLAKMALNASFEGSTRSGLYYEATAQAVTFEDEDKYDRMDAFLKSRAR